MTTVLSAASNLSGVLVALTVAVIAYLSDVGTLTLVGRSLVSGVACALVFRLLGFVVIAALESRFGAATEHRQAPASKT